VQDDAAIFAIRDEIEKQKVMPAVVVIEGLDITMSKPSETSISRPLRLLNELAWFYHIAIIGTVGSPKQNNKQFYELDRDSIYGSALWGRMTDTLILLKYVKPNPKRPDENTDNLRVIRALPRDGKPETFNCHWEKGRLVETAIEAAVSGDSADEVAEWMKQQKNPWNVLALVDGVRKSESTCRRLVKRLLDTGKIRVKPGPRNYHDLPEYQWTGLHPVSL
jgi:hypothetical protein